MKNEKKERKAKTKKIRRPSRIALVLVCLLLVIFIAVNVVCQVAKPYFGLVNNILTGGGNASTEEATSASQKGADMTLAEEEEAIVLLDNKNHVLPLDNGTKLNVFGYGSWNTTFGGTGSGASDSSSNVTLIEGLTQAGFTVNQDLVDFYAKNGSSAEDMGLVGTDWGIYENPVSDYSDALIESCKEFSDTAVYIVSRMGGEGYDLPLDMADYNGGEAGKSYLELQQVELDLLAMLEENFDNLIIIVNSTNAMELGFLDDEAVDAAISIGCPGSTGCTAVGEVLAGTVNPSGRTADTYAYEVESAPSYYTFGAKDYTNIRYTNTALAAGTGDAEGMEGYYHYMEYVEGIYVGYRYYETAAADGFIDYEKTVQYPFGYGLSYTTFDEKITDFTDDGINIMMQVEVTNTGDVAGKDVAELYYSAPYTPGGIEKSSVVLGGFAKTGLLEPGQSETVTISLTYEDMASYDYTGVKAEGGAYVLEAGDYEIRLQSDSHNVIDSRTVPVAKDVIYNDDNDGARSTDGIVVVNQFDEASFGADLTYVSRADWKGTMPTERMPDSKEASEAIVEALTNVETTVEDDTPAKVETTNNHLKLSDMKGLEYDDPKWDDLLDQIKLDEMTVLVSNGGWVVMEVSSVDKPAMSDCDGPNAINNFMSGAYGNAYTNQTNLACTWNADLAYQKGQIYGQEIEAYGIQGIYGPACNIHRSPFSGRNYEYFSEDGYLSGVVCAAEVKGINESNVYCYVKHFAVNDQENHRCDGGLVTWSNEQAIREIYLKPFEMAVKEGETLGIMSSFNRIGTTPTAESYPLLTTILRNEWGFHGTVVTDCVMACTTEDVNRALLAGNDLQLSFLQQMNLTDTLTGTTSGIAALRQATKNILYTAVASGALDATGGVTLYGWLIPLIILDIVILGLFVLYFVLRHRKKKRWKAAQITVE